MKSTVVSSSCFRAGKAVTSKSVAARLSALLRRVTGETSQTGWGEQKVY